MSVLAIDPGQRNMGVWLGEVVGDDLKPQTAFLDKFDIVARKRPAYEGAVDALAAQPWLPRVKSAVVETQDPRNIPHRIIATAAYGYLRGRGIECEFSSSKLKNDAMAAMAERCGVRLREKPTKEEMPDPKQRRRVMHDINKLNSECVVRALLDDLGDVELKEKLEKAKDPNGKKKGDDLADAMLLGIGLCLKRGAKSKKPATRRKKKIAD